MRTAGACVVGLAQRVAKGQGKDWQGQRGRVDEPGQRGVVKARGEGCDRTCVGRQTTRRMAYRTPPRSHRDRGRPYQSG